MAIIVKLLKSLPFRLVIAVILAYFLSPHLPLFWQQFFYALSLTLKELLILMIPFIIFSSVYLSFSQMAKKAILFMVLLFVCIVLSNFVSVNLAGLFGLLAFGGSQAGVLGNIPTSQTLHPLWHFSWPNVVANHTILLIAVALALMNPLGLKPYVNPIAHWARKASELFLKWFFVPMLPVFIFGFLLKLTHDHRGGVLDAFRPESLVLIVCVPYIYLFFLYVLAVFFNRDVPIAKNLITPAVTAFTTMSSAATLPFSIKAAEANTKNREIADAVMPATVNIHMIGSSFLIPLLALFLMASFGMEKPSWSQYLLFAVLFGLTKFSSAGVPGGCLLVMLPVMERVLGFTPEMCGLITVFYMLVNPFATLGNVLGNNLFVIHFNKIYLKAERLWQKITT